MVEVRIRLNLPISTSSKQGKNEGSSTSRVSYDLFYLILLLVQ